MDPKLIFHSKPTPHKLHTKPHKKRLKPLHPYHYRAVQVLIKLQGLLALHPAKPRAVGLRFPTTLEIVLHVLWVPWLRMRVSDLGISLGIQCFDFGLWGGGLSVQAVGFQTLNP